MVHTCVSPDEVTVRPADDTQFVTETTPHAKIGRYQLVRRLRCGGQAEVYLARHPTLGCEVVVKLAREQVPGESDLRQALEQEGRLLATVHHPGLARVLDADFHHDRPFLVLEYVRGITLREATAQERPTATVIVDRMLQLCTAVEAAHRQGAWHLDLQPDNVLVGPTGELRVIDFGAGGLRLACHRGRDLACVIGTPEYMSPEQHAGDPAELSPQTDVYGLGGILYFQLYGEPPHANGVSTPAFCEAVDPAWCQSQPAERSRLVRPVGREEALQRDLIEICRRALAAEPSQRYGSVAQLADAMRAARLAGRRQLWQRAIALLLMIAGVALILAAWRWKPAGPEVLQLRPQVLTGSAWGPLPAGRLTAGHQIQVDISAPDPERTCLYLVLGNRVVMPCRPLIGTPDDPHKLRYPRAEGWTLSDLAEVNLLLAGVPRSAEGIDPRELRQSIRALDWNWPPEFEDREFRDALSQKRLAGQADGEVQTVPPQITSLMTQLDKYFESYHGIVFRGATESID